MKAIVYTQYGTPDVLQLKEVEKPVPGDNEVLIKVHAASINFADMGFITGKPVMVRLWSGVLKPKFKIPGADVAGRVEKVGRNVVQFKQGDEVFGDLSLFGWGSYAEYVCTDEKALALKPANCSFEETAAVPIAAVTALQGLRYKGGIKPGQKVLINGASGGVGSFAVQIAKSFGAEVTAVCSTGKLEMVRSIGADHAIDYTKENFTKNRQLYDFILAANGYHSLSDYKRSLSPNGIYSCTGGSGTQIFESMLLGPWFSISGTKKIGNMGVAKPNQKDLIILKELMEAGKIKSVVDKVFPLSETAEAFRYFGKRHVRGKIVITMA